jgi:hypothetical protein
VSASAYHQRTTGARAQPAVDDERLVERIREVPRRELLRYGSRRMWKALDRAGEPIGRCRVERLMGRHQGAKRRGRPWRSTTSASSRPGLLLCQGEGREGRGADGRDGGRWGRGSGVVDGAQDLPDAAGEVALEGTDRFAPRLAF